jgi:hypothetical protein
MAETVDFIDRLCHSIFPIRSMSLVGSLHCHQIAANDWGYNRLDHVQPD